MTVNEYRKKHKRCRTCVYGEVRLGGEFYCRAKRQMIKGGLHQTKIKGMFCKVYKAREEEK